MAGNGIGDETIARLVGTLVGSVLSFAILLPRTIADWTSRLIVAPLSGFYLGDTVRELLPLTASLDHIRAGSLLAALFSWVVLGAFWRLGQTASWANIPWFGKKK